MDSILEKTRRFLHLPDLICLLFIFVMGRSYLHNIHQFIDIGLYDESGYLYNGMTIRNRLPGPEGAPFYAIWYYLLSLRHHDAVSLYFLNYKAMTVLPALMIFVALRGHHVTRTLCFVIAIAFLFSPANLDTWPKVGHFAVVCLLFGFFLSSLFRDRRLQAGILTVTALAASYIRPEFFLAFILLLIFLASGVLRNRKSQSAVRSAYPLLAICIPSMILMLCFGLPLYEEHRSMVAFGQHYSGNWVQWHHDSRNHWTYWEAIIKSDFGNVDSVFGALMSNPSAMIRHVMQNLRNIPQLLEAMFGSTFFLVDALGIVLASGLIVFWISWIAYVRKCPGCEAMKKKFIENARRLRFFAIPYLLMLLPVVISIVLIAPRQHHLFVLGALLAFGFAVLLFRETEQSFGHANYAILALLCVTSLVTVRPLTRASSQPNLKTISVLRSLGVEDSVNILEAEGGYGFYVGKNYHRIAEYEKNSSFGDFVKERSINMIVVSDVLARDPRFGDDPQWRSFLKNPAKYGFREIAMPNVEGRNLYVSKELNRKESVL